MAVSIYDEQFMTEDQKKQLRAFTDAWNRANAAGDTAGMESAHAAAERLRAQAGNYSGGGEGDRFLDLGSGQGALGTYYGGTYSGGYSGDTYSGGTALPEYEPAQVETYRPQTQAVNDLYDAARDVKLAGLRSAYEADAAELEAQRSGIGALYDRQRRELEAQSQLQGRSFNEYAAASGLSSGAGGQARLAMGNQLQSGLAGLSAQEAGDRSELERQIAGLKSQYRNGIASAVAEGEYQRAAVLLDEYRKAAQSAVTASQARADENYRAYKAAVDRVNALNDESYRAWQSGASYRSDLRQQAEDRARELAKYGDFSGYGALGYSDGEIAGMRGAWAASHPALAYGTGAITAQEYYDLTGSWPVSMR